MATLDLEGILDIEIKANSFEEEDMFDHRLELMEWTEQQLIIFVNFTHPLIISSGMFPDQMVCKIMNTSMFLDSESGLEVAGTDLKFFKNIPKQLPSGLKQEDVESQAKSAQNAMNGMIFLQLFLQIFMKGSLNDLWSLYFAMQMLCYLKNFATPLPISAQIFNDEFVKIIEFDILNPEGIIKIFHHDFSMRQLLSGNP